MSLINLGLGIDTSGLAKGKSDMQALVPAAKDLQTAAEGVANSVNKIGPAATGAAAAIGKTTPAAQGLKTATDGLASSVAKTSGAFVTQEQRIRQAVTETQRYVAASEQAANGTGLARHELINLSRQLQDVGVSLVSGQSLFMVMAQQGAQIADIYGSSKTGTVGGSLKQLGGIIASLITPMRALALGVAAVGAASYAAYGSWKSFTLQLDDAAKAAGTTTASMAQLQAAASIKGISSDEFNKGMQSFASSVYDAKNGMGELAQVFRVNNVHAATFDGAMEKAADLIQRAGSDQQRLQLLQQMGLPATMEWVRLLSNGAAGLKSAKDSFAEFSANEQLVKKAREFDEAWNRAWTNFGLNARSAFQKAIEFGSTFFDKMDKLAKQAGNASFWNNFIPNNAKPEDFGLQSVPMSNARVSSGFDALSQLPSNTALQDALRRRAGGGTVDPNVLQHNIQLEQQHIALLGQSATASDAVRQVELAVAQARANGVSISQQQVDVLKRLAYEQALGITQIKASTDSYNVETATIGKSIGVATQYAAAQNAINEAKRAGRALSGADIAAINAEAAALGQAAQAAAEAQAKNQAMFDLQTAGLSGVELQIAQLNRQLHGDDWKSYGDSATANLMRIADAQKQLNDAMRGFASDLLSNLQQGKSAFASLESAAQSFANKLANIGLDKMFAGLKNGSISFDLSSLGSSVGKSASQGIVEGFDAIQAKAAAARSNPANSFSFNGMSGGSTAMAGMGAAAVGLGAFGQGQQAGAAGGSMISSGISGVLSGGMAGFAFGGPIGAAVGALVGGVASIFGFSSGQSQAAKQAKADWAAAKSAADTFGKQLAGGGQGTLTSSIAQARGQLDQYIQLAQKAGDKDAVAKLQGQYDQFINRMSNDFMKSFGGVIDALSSGLGPNSPFASGAQNVKDIGDQLKGFIEDAKLAFSGSPVDFINKDGAIANAQAEADAVAKATSAAQKYMLSLLGQAPVLTDTQTAIQHLNGTATQLQSTLVDLGMSSQDAAAAIQAGVLASMKQLADTFTNGIQREINAATGQDYKNSLADLVAKFQSNLADAAALGLNSDLVNQWFKVSAQKIVNDAGLAGGAVADLVRQFPQLAGVVTASSTALQAVTQDLLATYNNAVSTVSDRRQDLVTAYQTEAKSIQDSIDKLKSYTAAFKQFQANLNVGQLSPNSPQQQYLDAQAQARQDFALAIGGDQDAMGRIQDDLSTYLDQSKSYNASSEQYFKDFQEAQDMLDKLQASGATQVNVAQRQLDALNAQVSGLIEINTSVQSVSAAIGALQVALMQQKSAAANLRPAAAASGDVDALYQSVLGRAPDAAGKLYWQQQIAAGMSGNDLMRSFVSGAIGAGQRNQVDPALLAKYGFANGGVIGNGIFGVDSVLARFANGGNVALAGGEGVLTAPATVGIGGAATIDAINRTHRLPGNDNSDVVTELKALRQDNQKMATAIERLGAIIGLSDQETRKLINEGNNAAKDNTSLLRKAVSKVA